MGRVSVLGTGRCPNLGSRRLFSPFADCYLQFRFRLGGMKIYRARNPRKSPLWQCAHRHFTTFLDRYPEYYPTSRRSEAMRLVTFCWYSFASSGTRASDSPCIQRRAVGLMSPFGKAAFHAATS